MQPEVVKRLLDAMAVHGIIRITFDPFVPNPELEIWTRSSSANSLKNLRKGIIPLNNAEVEYFSHEYKRNFDET